MLIASWCRLMWPRVPMFSCKPPTDQVQVEFPKEAGASAVSLSVTFTTTTDPGPGSPALWVVDGFQTGFSSYSLKGLSHGRAHKGFIRLGASLCPSGLSLTSLLTDWSPREKGDMVPLTWRPWPGLGPCVLLQPPAWGGKAAGRKSAGVAG